MKEQQRCPSCQRKLFEIEFDSSVDITIKCPKCRNLIRLYLNKQKKIRIAEVTGKEAKDK